MDKILFLITLFIFNYGIALSQSSSTGYCATQIIANKMMEDDPSLKLKKEEADRQLKEYLAKHPNDFLPNKSAITYTVPVVVHIIHENGPENIPVSRVKDVIDRLNLDFQKLNADTALVVAPFNAIIGNMDMRFRLATKDPNGNCTNGITRTFNPSFTNSGGCANGNCGLPRPIAWPQEKYLNIYVVKDIDIGTGGPGIVAAYATPTAPTGISGVYCNDNFFNGNDRTMTHEIAHMLSLSHTWGATNSQGLPSNCSSDDGIADTPNCTGILGGCALNRVSCGTLDNVQNYMDYASCSIMFTQGQINWMSAAVNTGFNQRNILVSPANLLATGTDDASYQTPACPPTADFVVNKIKECEGGTINFTNRSHHAFADASNFSYNWTFNGGTPASSTVQNPSITYNTASTYTVSLAVSLPGVGSNTKTSNSLIEITPGSGAYIGPYLEKFSDPSWPFNFNSSLAWKIDKPAGSLFEFQRSTNAFYSAPSSVYLNNFSFNNTGDFELTTPVADLTSMQSGSAFLNFQLAHAQKGNETEVLRLLVSTDCGESFSIVRIWQGNFINSVPPTSSLFVPSDTSEWNFISQDISTYAGMDNVQFKFIFNAKSGNNIWFDDINISNTNQPVVSSLREDLFSDFNLYPNPNEGVFTLEFNVSDNQSVTAEIVDMIGKSTSIEFSESISQGWNTATIDTRSYNMKPGMYFLKLKSGDQVFSKRLMIQ